MIPLTILLVIPILILLQVSDAFWSNLPVLITSLVTALLALGAFIRAGQAKEKSTETASKVDGLLDKKAIADEAIGAEKERTAAAEKKAIGDDRELKMIREQQLINQPPPGSNPNRDSDLKKAEDKIVETLETQIHKKGEEMKEVVKEKADDIQDEVKVVPEKTAEEVVDKLKPK